MDLNAQKNDLCFKDPLEELRNLFRSYCRCITNEDMEQANDIWENQVSIELDSINRSCPEISRESLQTVFFEEKRRLQDHDLLAEVIFEKMANHLNQVSLSSDVATKVHLTSPQAESSAAINARSSNSGRKSDASEGLPATGLDLTAMIDSMLEDEKLLNR